MQSREIRQKYLEFFRSKNHQIIPSASLVPADDPTVLFTTAGMHPLVPFLMGRPHPAGSRLANYQKCLRTDDIDEVGDETHNTFFEMLGNWSLGDYWKEESIAWSYEFLTGKDWLAISPDRLAASVFAGDDDSPRDEESAGIWKRLGLPLPRLAYLGKKDNWWGPPGQTGPCGPDTEIFCWTGEGPAPERFDPADKRWVEIWNNVFMQYEKTADGKFAPLRQRNVDTGMGLERITAAMNRLPNVYETDLFAPIMEAAAALLPARDRKAERVISDHVRASVFLIADGVTPSNKDRGYILRRLIRRAVTYARKQGVSRPFTAQVAQAVTANYRQFYPELGDEKVIQELQKEEGRFLKTLERGLRMIEGRRSVTGKEAFDLFQTYGFPIELTRELVKVEDEEEFQKELARHQEQSRTASAGQFKGGLTGSSDKIIRLHTATHLLNAALRLVLGGHVRQRGSNITEERTRFDFTHPGKLTEEQKAKVEELVNQWIKADLAVNQETMPRAEAEKLGAVGVFGEKYGETVSVYTVLDPGTGSVVSREFCGGPHVKRTGTIGRFKIRKEEAVAAGVRRIKAVVE